MLTVPNFHRLETAHFDLRGYNALITEPLDNAGGRLKVPDRPGLGIEMNVEYLRRQVIDGIGG